MKRNSRSGTSDKTGEKDPDTKANQAMAGARIIPARSAPISPQEQPPPARAPREVERPGRVRGARQRRNRFLIVARLHRPRDEEDS